jgi:hypothetical protein
MAKENEIRNLKSKIKKLQSRKSSDSGELVRATSNTSFVMRLVLLGLERMYLLSSDSVTSGRSVVGLHGTLSRS